MVSFLAALLLGILFDVGHCQLCDDKAYAENTLLRLKNSSIITEQYDITVGRLVWYPNETIWAANPNGIYAIYEMVTRETQWGIYLRSMDAIIFSGCTPPSARYFSWDSYLFYSYQGFSSTWPFASLGDALNHLVINTTDSPSSFNTLSTIIHTGDQQTFLDIQSALDPESASSDMNLMPVPSKYFNFVPYGISDPYLHHNLSYDTFMTLVRIAIPEEKTQYDEYIARNQTVLFLEKRNVQKGQRQPRTPLVAQVRDTFSTDNINETAVYLDDVMQYIADLTSNLTSEYALKLESREYFVNNYDAYNISDYGFSCIEYDRQCVGDDRDAQYWSVNLTSLEQHVFVVAGVNSVAVNLSSAYQSFAYYNHGNMGQASLTNDEYAASVVELGVPTSVSTDVLSNLYVIQFARPANVGIVPGIPAIPIPEMNLTWVQPNARDYLNAITKTRPDKHQMIPPVLLTFRIPS